MCISKPAGREILEVNGGSCVDVAANCVPGPWEGVTVTWSGRAQVRALTARVSACDERRLPVEDVVHTQAQVEMLSDVERRGKIEIALSWNVQAGVKVEIAVEGRVISQGFRFYLTDISPLCRKSDAIRHLEAYAELMSPFRHRCGARHGVAAARWAIKPGAIVWLA